VTGALRQNIIPKPSGIRSFPMLRLPKHRRRRLLFQVLPALLVTAWTLFLFLALNDGPERVKTVDLPLHNLDIITITSRMVRSGKDVYEKRGINLSESVVYIDM